MNEDLLSSLEFRRIDEPTPSADLGYVLNDWLVYQRAQFVRKLRDLRPDQLAEWSIPPVKLSVLGWSGT
jgi:hypothetical protein